MVIFVASSRVSLICIYPYREGVKRSKSNPDNGSHCRIEPLCWVLRSLRHHVLEEDWCMIWIVPVAHHHN